MKKLIDTILLVLVALMAQAQILTPVTWTIRLDDKDGSADKEIVFTATADEGWHLYDMDLPEGGPISTSFTFSVLNGVELMGSVDEAQCQRVGIPLRLLSKRPDVV